MRIITGTRYNWGCDNLDALPLG